MKKKLIQKIGFSPKENVENIFAKKYNNFIIEVDFNKEQINYGNKIKSESGTTQNFSKEENWVVLECVNRLLEKGYKPEDITLEKRFKVGHGVSGGRVDIFVEKEGKAFLMIECKTFGKEFEKELKNINKDGGQLFTYFQNDTNAEVLMLYTSQLNNEKIEYKNEIIKIEEHYRNAGNVADFYNRWNKITNQNGIFEEWVSTYNFENKSLTKKDLKILKDEDSGFIFNSFLSILRKHSISDKPNAFNKIFNLFLAKILDEQKNDIDELDFQWKEKTDDAIDFQVRLINLHKDGIYAFLQKEIEGISDSDFSAYKTEEERKSKKKKLLIFNNVFAIKEVFDNETFEDNQKVLKEVVELLQQYQIRYPRKQQHLSDFFERLLTTGLKQEAGQFFTPPLITKFIIKSIPLKEYIEKDLDQVISKLPAVIDYAAGSGHFITEIMEAYQDILDKIDIDSLHYPNAKKDAKKWRENPYDWASKYIYGIEKDYRLVKVAKVGCYFYGDGLAQIVYGDGLDNFANSKSFVGLLKENIDDSEKAKFSFVVSNPPYSVSSFKGDLKNLFADKDFTLYKYLTDNSSEIECLFIERTKQLLKEGGIAAVVLPSSILSNTGIYTKAREIILQNFKIIAIAELGSNTFMATGTKTVVLFLRRKNNNIIINLQNSVNNFFDKMQDVTMNGIEKPITKFIKNVWEGINFVDYITLIKKEPNEVICNHEIYKEYKKKIKVKNEKEFWEIVLKKENEKLLYFIIAYNQKVVVVKTGEKDAEKGFLGYEFSNRRGSEGMHPIQRGKTIDECTQLFDTEVFDNPEKASTYIYKAFSGDYDFPISENIAKNISRHNLINMLTFDRVDFEKTILLSAKKKLKIESRWEVKKLSEVAQIDWGNTNLTKSIFKENGRYNVYSATGLDGKTDFFENKEDAIILSAIGARCGRCFYATGKWTAIKNTIVIKNKKNILLRFLFEYINNENYWVKSGTAQPFITVGSAYEQKIPLPPKDIQEKIIDEIKKLEEKEEKNKEEVEKLKNTIPQLIEGKWELVKVGQIANTQYGFTDKATSKGEIRYLRITDLNDNGSINLKNEAKFINPSKETKNQFLLNNNDIVIARSGSVGKSAIYKSNKYEKMIFASYLIRLIIDENKVLPQYLFNFTKTKMYWDQVKANSVIVAQPNLNAEKIKGFKIPLPPLFEQQKVVSKIEKIEEKINELEKELTEIPKQKEEILKKYLEK
ncbi:restriction endonuclease subunit S [Candidatus Kuenenbacteria bacterium HGW-Kuenenbacteria-1]|uniref:Restriction endonuclease subunit S n=1 Tax=Candidatus Kuenenbacteria bacterium HGW-Kuenenbacteria-1 TaxID=2013812 RepID=A0A2N1UN43_9BACT|nr:MAG: restriction endonuclease subunit S [Candidatus Kuenenbacteria bacterium HGW-Kuenenbacteria-1]